jgi:hypothetical protein
MLNNTTNINKTNNHSSSQIIEHKKLAQHRVWEILVLALTGTKQICGEV